MAQPLRNTNVVSLKKAPRAAPAALPEEVRPIPGVAGFLALDRLIKDMMASKKEEYERIRPVIEAIVAAGAAKKSNLEDVKRTYMASDDGVIGQVQMRSKNVKKLDLDEIKLLRRFKVPVKVVPGQPVINPIYTEPGVTTVDVVAKLTKLIESNPGCGIPANLFIKTDTVTVPDEGALLRGLKLAEADRALVLGVLADIVVMRGEMKDTKPLLKILNEKVKQLSTD